APPPIPAKLPLPPREPAAAASVPASPPLAPAPSPRLAQRLSHGAIAAVAMSFGISLFTRGRADDVGQYLFIIAGCAGAILFVERWLAHRLGLWAGIGRRLAVFAHAVPVLLVAQAAFGTSERLVYAVLAAVALADWSARTKARRAEPASLQLAVAAAILGGVLAAIFGADPLRGAGILAALSLVTGAVAPFARPVRTEASLGAEAARPAPPPVAVPVPPASVSGKTKLSRPRTDRWIAGVASGLARTYGWDAVWVRVGFLLLTVFAGVGPVIYLVLWICMPGDPAPRGEPRFLPLGFLMRMVWVAAATAFAFAAAAALGRAQSFHVFGLDRETSANLVATGCIALAAASVLLAFATPVRTGPPARSPRDAGGWSALGSVLLALALLPVLLGALLASDAGGDIFGDRLPGGRWIQDFGKRGAHFVIAALFFLPGFFCVLLGRRAGGAAHVFRGAIGWTAAGAVVAMVASSIPALLHPAGPDLGPSRYVADYGVVASLAALSVLCLAWPKRSERGEVKP
ncbi:MAG: PspC domain-containing protein, partial [Planctomycetota bacterium]